VIDFGANRKRVCDFLLVRNSNLGPILHHFGDMTAFMCSWPHLYSIVILGCYRCTRPSMLGSASAWFHFPFLHCEIDVLCHHFNKAFMYVCM